MLVESHISQTK